MGKATFAIVVIVLVFVQLNCRESDDLTGTNEKLVSDILGNPRV